MKPEQQLGVKFIGYSAFLVTPSGNGEDKMLANLDFVTGALFVPGPEGNALLIVRKKEQLKPLLRQLRSAIPELQNAIKNSTEQEVDVRGFDVYVDPATSRIVVSAGENSLLLERDAELGLIVEDILQRTENWDSVLKQIDKVGRKFKRIPYDEFISNSQGGCFSIQVHGFGIFRSGRLELLSKPV